MSASRRKAFLVSAAIVGGAMLMTACQDTDAGAGGAQGSSSSTPAPDKADSASGSSATGGKEGGGKDSAGESSNGQGTTSGSGSSGSAGSAGSAGSGEGAKLDKCRTDGLKITAADVTIDGDAVELKNTGGKDCAISGYAGVDLKTNAGSLSAKRSGEPVTPGILKPGKSTYFGITYPENKTGGSGVRITGLVVTPPDETKSVTLPWPGAGSLPVTDGSGTPVKVGPMGSAGQGESGS